MIRNTGFWKPVLRIGFRFFWYNEIKLEYFINCIKLDLDRTTILFFSSLKCVSLPNGPDGEMKIIKFSSRAK